jgi:hypothetical protein
MAVVSTSGAADIRVWRSKPRRALVVRVALAIMPVVAAFVVTWLVAPTLPRSAGPLGPATYVGAAAVVGTVVALLARRVANRFLPVTALLKMTLVFPDHAPSRFKLALRTGTVRQFRRALANGDPVLPANHQAAAERLIALAGELGRHEHRTRGHSDRVRAYADMIGAELDLPPAQRQKLAWAATVHDIGKLAVPADILNRSGHLTEVEWAILAQHPTVGATIVEPLAGWLGDWRHSAGDHHERWDGAGYPRRLAGTNIPLAGRIVAVADAYDAMISRCASRRTPSLACPVEAARAELAQGAGGQFDPRVVQALHDALEATRPPARGFGERLAALVASTEPTAAAGELVRRGATVVATAAAIGIAAGLTPLGPGPADVGPAAVIDAARRSVNTPAPRMLPFAESPALPTSNIPPSTEAGPPPGATTTTTPPTAPPTTPPHSTW